jgi:hypothetical protein
VSIVLPFLTALQMFLPWFGRWVGAFHPLNAILVLALFVWLTHRLRQEEPAEPVATPPAAVPAG